MLSDIFAAIALLISVISLIHSIRIGRRQHQLTSRQIEAHDREVEASSRARLTATVVKEPSQARAGSVWRVVIRNQGPADARNVQLEFKEPQQFVSPSELAKLPVSVLAAGEEVRLIASAAIGQPSKYDILLKWEDNEARSEQRVLVR